MKQNFKLIPFDLKKAKTPENPNGLEVVTRVGEKVEIIYTNYKGLDGSSIIGVIHDNKIGDNKEPLYDRCYSYGPNGYFRKDREDNDDLFLKEPIKSRRMTNQELAWWLGECPNEHREWKTKTGFVIYNNIAYQTNEAQCDCGDEVLIRSNGGEWREPLIEREEEN